MPDLEGRLVSVILALTLIVVTHYLPDLIAALHAAVVALRTCGGGTI